MQRSVRTGGGKAAGLTEQSASLRAHTASARQGTHGPAAQQVCELLFVPLHFRQP